MLTPEQSAGDVTLQRGCTFWQLCCSHGALEDYQCLEELSASPSPPALSQSHRVCLNSDVGGEQREKFSSIFFLVQIWKFCMNTFPVLLQDHFQHKTSPSLDSKWTSVMTCLPPSTCCPGRCRPGLLLYPQLQGQPEAKLHPNCCFVKVPSNTHVLQVRCDTVTRYHP